MTRFERTGTRSLLFSSWHRTLSDSCVFIDLDYCAYCHDCKEPLWLMELAYDNGMFKATTITRRLAERAGLPAYLVFFCETDGLLTQFRWQQIVPTYGEFQIGTPDVFGSWIEQQHANHDCPGTQVMVA